MSAWEGPGQSNDWYTPAYIFEALGERFDLDVAAPEEGPRYVPADRWLWENSLGKRWSGFVWMNPPFGGPNALVPWLDKFIAYGNGIALMPDRTSARWFQKAAPRVDSVLFVAPKVKFEQPNGKVGRSPGSGTALMACGARGIAALRRGHKLGWLAK